MNIRGMPVYDSRKSAVPQRNLLPFPPGFFPPGFFPGFFPQRENTYIASGTATAQ